MQLDRGPAQASLDRAIQNQIGAEDPACPYASLDRQQQLIFFPFLTPKDMFPRHVRNGTMQS
jgi:hypothetical protein